MVAMIHALVLVWLQLASVSGGMLIKPQLSLDYQSDTGVTQQIYLLPAEESSAQLQTHKIVHTVVDNLDGTVSVYAEALYQLKNAEDDPVTVPLLLFFGVGGEKPQEIALSANGQPLILNQADSGAFSAEVIIPADSRVLLEMDYRVIVDNTLLATVRYAPSVLNRWRGPTSTRVEYWIPDYIPRESWTSVAPNTWTYATANVDHTAIKWLHDSVVPDEEFILQFFMPQTWQQLTLTRASAQDGAPASNFLALGNLYRKLATADAVNDTVANWYISQAVAAYSDGLSLTTSTSPDVLAQLHIGLASIYRNQAAEPGADAVASSASMVSDAAAALAFMTPDDPRRSELQQWLADGLRVMFDDARNSGDWQRASEIVDQMSGLPPGTINQALVQEGQQIVLAQQALLLLRRGELQAVADLVGENIDIAAADTPAEYVPLFDAWRITVRAYLESISIEVRAMPNPERSPDAQQKLEALYTTWQTESDRVSETHTTWTMSPVRSAPSGELIFSLESSFRQNAGRPIHFLSDELDFVFLRTTLDQIGPTTLTQTKLLQQETMRSQPVDLRAAGNRWNSMAAELDRLASENRQVNTSDDPSATLLAEMLASNYGETAEDWRRLVRDSWLLFQFDSGSSAAEPHTWYATADSAPTVYTVKTQNVSTDRLYLGLLSLVIIVCGLTGLLWWLV